MGMFDFLSSAGDDAEAATKTVEVSQDRMNELRQKSITEKLAALDIEGEQVQVSVNGEVAVLSGQAPSQEAMEKMVLCAGNQFGIGKVDCQLAVDAPAAADDATAATAAAVDSVFYTVKSGDTLGKIAAAHYGDAGKYTTIFEANQPMLKDPNKIFLGQSLRIPPQ